MPRFSLASDCGQGAAFGFSFPRGRRQRRSGPSRGIELRLIDETPADEAPIEQLIRSARLLKGDSVPPTTTALRAPEPNEAGWNRGDVTVTLGAADEGGSGVKEIVVRAAGAQPIAETLVSGNSATILVTADGETTIRTSPATTPATPSSRRRSPSSST